MLLVNEDANDGNYCGLNTLSLRAQRSNPIVRTSVIEDVDCFAVLAMTRIEDADCFAVLAMTRWLRSQ